jgi:hypothetical protein
MGCRALDDHRAQATVCKRDGNGHANRAGTNHKYVCLFVQHISLLWTGPDVSEHAPAIRGLAGRAMDVKSVKEARTRFES